MAHVIFLALEWVLKKTGVGFNKLSCSQEVTKNMGLMFFHIGTW